MRTANELVRATKPFAREVRWRSWWHFASTLAVLAGLLALTCLEAPWVGAAPHERPGRPGDGPHVRHLP
jgi:hypothetical protein